jgi:hypothetical protein
MLMDIYLAAFDIAHFLAIYYILINEILRKLNIDEIN